MNTPNKLTIARIVAVPVFMAVLLLEIFFPDAKPVTRFAAAWSVPLAVTPITTLPRHATPGKKKSQRL